jgi:hypothetical protein
MSNASVRYSIISILFHWSVAALVIFLAVQGALIDDMPRETKAWWVNLHSAISPRPCQRAQRHGSSAPPILPIGCFMR